ncbi:MAG: glycoside hydrolase family 25 protein [Ruminiclostridium sp.]|nr:glycoside hydrolase family 25 protein [Ruminiclostridium sp.]
MSEEKMDITGGEPEELIGESDAQEDAAETDDIYVYDAEDDEPVEDKDLYRDYSGSVRHYAGVSEVNAVSAVSPSEKSEKAIPGSVQMNTAGQDSQREMPPSVRKRAAVADEERAGTSQVKVNRIYTINTVISMITLCAVAAGTFSGYAYIRKLEQELSLDRARISELEDVSKTSVSGEADGEYIDAVSLIDEEEMNEPGVPVSASEIDIERGKLLLYDSYVGYSWVPVLSGVKPHSYKKENFKVDDDYRMQYVVDGEVSSYFGIDVSSHQGAIDWDAVRSDGVEFAILRIGVRGYGEEGNIKLDDRFFENYENAHKAGIDLGVYFYSQALNADEAAEEAKFVLDQLDGRKLEYPVVFDWEPVDASTAETTPRTEDIMPGTLTLSAVAFCEAIRDAGYEAMIYTNKKMAYIKYDMRRLTDYPVWLALYNTDLTYYYDFDMWQYGFGRVDGIEGDVDLDISIIRK